MGSSGTLSLIALACVLVVSIGSGIQAGGVNRIFAGDFAKPGEFPFMAFMESFDRPNWRSRCGGTIIGKRHILTAAHCVEKLKPNETRVMLGCHLLSDCLNAYKVEEIISHPDFRRENNDIAILKLVRPIEFNQVVGSGSIGKISLNEEEIKDEQWGELMLIGWGFTQSAKPSDALKKARVETTPLECCKDDPNLPIIHDDEMCAVGAFACLGDWGGPLFKKHRDGTRLLVGIVRGGIPHKCIAGGVYTRVASHYSWIEEQTRECVSLVSTRTD